MKAPFVEEFDASWDARWKPSHAVKQRPDDYTPGENENPEDLFRYRGEWSVETPPGDAKTLVAGDKCLAMKTPAAHHAISVAFPKPVDPAGKDLVVQFDVKFKEELRCSGSYIKLLTESKNGIKYQEFDDKTPYTIMFGPDFCGSTNKIHFIFRHRNPLTGKWEEKHYRHAPSIKNDLKSNLYTLHVHPNNTFHILINNERTKTGSLLEDFDPPVNPSREIDDPEDKKPADWVDEPKIPDPDAVKPADWDEDAPLMIPDADATKPDDWLEDEPEFVADPNATKPDDWDDEEDGKWVAPQVPNPACEKAAGCGVWTAPMKPNPEYKGKWHAPLIDNPKYKGAWEPRKIANPNFFEDLEPSKFTKIMGIGIEDWVMQPGICFDNFYVGHSAADAKKFAQDTWGAKRQLEDAEEEKARKEAEERAKEDSSKSPEDATTAESSSDKPATATDMQSESPLNVESIQNKVLAFIALAQKDPVQAAKTYPYVLVSLLALLVAPFYLFSSAGQVSKVRFSCVVLIVMGS